MCMSMVLFISIVPKMHQFGVFWNLRAALRMKRHSFNRLPLFKSIDDYFTSEFALYQVAGNIFADKKIHMRLEISRSRSFDHIYSVIWSI